MREDKRIILNALAVTLKLTSAYEDLQEITYEVTEGNEYAVLNFSDRPSLHIDITADSGIAIIIDVVGSI